MSSYIGDPDFEGFVNEHNRNRETSIRNFPITLGVWAIGAENRTGVGRLSLAMGQCQVLSGIRNQGFVRQGVYNLVKADFPMGEFPIKARNTGVNVHWVSRFVRPELVSSRLAITRSLISR
jgi:hypothetical protein